MTNNQIVRMFFLKSSNKSIYKTSNSNKKKRGGKNELTTKSINLMDFYQANNENSSGIFQHIRFGSFNKRAHIFILPTNIYHRSIHVYLIR